MCLTAYTSANAESFTNGCAKGDSLAARRVLRADVDTACAQLRAELDTARVDFIKAAFLVKVLRSKLDSTIKVSQEILEECKRNDNTLQLISVGALIVLAILVAILL